MSNKAIDKTSGRPFDSGESRFIMYVFTIISTNTRKFWLLL